MLISVFAGKYPALVLSCSIAGYQARLSETHISFTVCVHPSQNFISKRRRCSQTNILSRPCSCRCWFNNEGIDVPFQFLFEGSFASSFETIKSGKSSWYRIETLEPSVAYSSSIDRFKNAQENKPLAKAAYC